MIRVTYDIYDAEGETIEAGFLDATGRRVPALIGRETPGVDMGLRAAVALAYPTEDVGHWFTEAGRGRVNYASGESESRSIHPPRNITPASYERLARLLGVRS